MVRDSSQETHLGQTGMEVVEWICLELVLIELGPSQIGMTSARRLHWLFEKYSFPPCLQLCLWGPLGIPFGEKISDNMLHPPFSQTAHLHLYVFVCYSFLSSVQPKRVMDLQLPNLIKSLLQGVPLGPSEGGTYTTGAVCFASMGCQNVW
jgi:hypothetical protein